MKRNTATSPQLQNNKIETYKLVFDLMKHLTTLSSGSILLLITLLEKVFRTAPPTMFIAMAFIGFCVSIVAAIIVMILLAYNATDGQVTEGERNAFGLASAVASVAFVLGILFIVSAALPSLG